MKLDGEAILFHGTVDHKSDSKPIEHESENTLENKDQNGTFCDMKAKEGKADQFQYAVSDEDDSTHDEEEILRDFVAPIPFDRSSLEIESFDKDAVFYVDKSVMEPELPELVVCYKENSYHVVKDICIDEGFPSNDKFLFDTDVDEKSFCTFLTEDTNCKKPQQKEIFSLRELLSMPEMGLELSKPKSSDNNVSQTNEQSQGPSENAIIEKPFSDEESENGNKQDFLACGETASVAEEFECGNEEIISQTLVPDIETKLLDHGHDGTVLSDASDSVTEELENANKKEEKSESHNMDADSDLSSNRKMESKSITFQNSDTRSPSRPEDIGTESFSSQRQYTPGESSFSAAGPSSGLISYSGPIAYSGSLSLRSDSSTTSSRSFAFPILQTEWNSSPVRMAKAERRLLRKHGNWRQVLCCRF